MAGRQCLDYHEFSDSVEVIRVLVVRPETREATCTVGLERCPNPHDRLALFGKKQNCISSVV